MAEEQPISTDAQQVPEIPIGISSGPGTLAVLSWMLLGAFITLLAVVGVCSYADPSSLAFWLYLLGLAALTVAVWIVPGGAIGARRRWSLLVRLIPVGVVLGALAAAIVYLLFEPQYEAVALLEIQEQSPYIAFPSQESHPKAYFNTQMDLIKSRWVLAPTIEQLSKDPTRPLPREIAREPDPVPWLSKRLKVVTQGDSSLFRISYSGPDPEDSARVVNTVQQQYLKLRADTEVKRNTGLLGILAGEVGEREKNVGEMRERVRKLAKEMTGRDPFLARAEAEPAPRQPSAELQGRLVTTEVDVAILQARIKAAEAEAQAAKPEAAGLSQQELAMRDAMVVKLMNEGPAVTQLNIAIAAKQTKLQELQASPPSTESDRSCKQLLEEVARDRRTLDNLERNILPRFQREAEVALIARRAEAEAAAAARQADELARMRSDLAARKILAERLKEEYDKESRKMQTGSGSTVEYLFARDELTRAENVFAMIAQRRLALQTEQGAPARILLRHAAVPAGAPIDIFPYRSVTLAFLTGMCLPFLFVGLRWTLVRPKQLGDDQKQ